MNRTVAEEKRLVEILEIVSENLGDDWKLLASTLGLSKSDVTALTPRSGGPPGSPSPPASQCLWALTTWSQRTPSAIQVRELRAGLERCGYMRLVDILMKLHHEPRRSVDAILQPHVLREERLKKAFYAIADYLPTCQNWRLLASKLGLSSDDIHRIESIGEERWREKCLNCLYRWRVCVPLIDFKIGNLVRALKQSGELAMADVVSKFASVDDPKFAADKKRKGEVIIHIDIHQLVEEGESRTSASYQSPSAIASTHEYVMNKLFIRFMDEIEKKVSAPPKTIKRQSPTTPDTTHSTTLRRALNITHPLVTYLYAQNEATISRVSRRNKYIAVECRNKEEQAAMWALVESGEITRALNQYFVRSDVLGELGIKRLSLMAFLNDWELMTSRSQAFNVDGLRKCEKTKQ